MENWGRKNQIKAFIHIPVHKSQFPEKAFNKSIGIKHVEVKKYNFSTCFSQQSHALIIMSNFINNKGIIYINFKRHSTCQCQL